MTITAHIRTDRAAIQKVEAITGWPVNWSSWAGRWVALQWEGTTCPGRAGLVWLGLDLEPRFASIRFDPKEAWRLGLSVDDIAALGLAAAGAVQYGGPRKHMRRVKARRIHREAVEAHALRNRT